MEKKKRTIITVVLSIIEWIIYHFLSYQCPTVVRSDIIAFLTYITPVGFLYALNYYILSPFIFSIYLTIRHLSGNYQAISRKFANIAKSCISWMVDLNCHWGATDSSSESQNANTCEGIIAIKKVGLDNRYNTIYQETLQHIFNELTDKGLSSRSLNNETVVCTSMALYLYSLEKGSFIQPIDAGLDEKINTIANHLWSVRSDDGWGVYLKKSSPNDISIANTFWALYALSTCGNISHTASYYSMVKGMYEYSTNSTFGYTKRDSARLWPTAMSIILYYSVDEQLRTNLSSIYDVKQAADFVFKQFCLKGVECEVETLTGIDKNGTSVRKAPWTHISIGVALEALVLAFMHKKVNLFKMNVLIEHIKILCKTRLVYVNNEKTKCYYIPRDMQAGHNGIYTFPTAYFAWGLSRFNFNGRGKQ